MHRTEDVGATCDIARRTRAWGGGLAFYIMRLAARFRPLVSMMNYRDSDRCRVASHFFPLNR